MSAGRDNGGGLSLQTLVIASLSSLAAALFVHEFWQGGAVFGAAVTPVIVALVSEALRRPAQVVTRRTAVNPPPVVTERDDRFGIWEDQRRPRRRLHVGLAVVTGVVAFAAAAFLLTGAELVLGGASDTDRFRVVPGKQERADRADRDAPARTEPRDAAPAPAPEEEAPEEEAPPTTTPPPTEPATPTTPEEAPPDAVPEEPGATAPVP